MERVRKLKSVTDLKEALDKTTERPLVLFKHSTRCPVSAEAYDEFSRHVSGFANPEVDYSLVLVVEDRPVSTAVAEELGVKHESPQVLLIKEKQAVWHTSHWRITEEALNTQIK